MTESVSGRRVANQLGALALRLGDAQRAALDRELGVSGEAAAALTAIAAFPGERVGFLGPVLGLTSAGAVRLVARLEALGLVERRPGGDARSHALRLTEAGRASVERLRSARQAVLLQSLEPLDDDALDTLAEILETVLARQPEDRDAARRMCRLCDHAVCDHAGACPVDAAVTARGEPGWQPPA